MSDRESLGVVKDPDRLEISWQGFDKRITNLKLPIKAKPDLAKIAAAMKKSGKSADFGWSLRGGKFKIEAQVGSEAIPIASLDVDGEKDLVKRRELLQKLRDGTELVTSADLAAFDKQHPPPPDPKKVAELREQIKFEQARIKVEQGIAKGLPKKFDDMNNGLREIGFMNWGKPKGLGPIIEFLNAVDWGRGVDAIVKEFIAPGASTPLKMRPETRKAIDDAIAANKAPDLKRLRTEMQQLLDSGFVARFSKEMHDSLDKGIGERQKHIKQLEGELTALGVKP